jgi:prepilin-type N-terminal cleavage/methylation domain-containing protein
MRSRRADNASTRRGFTLLEVIAALSLSGLALLGASHLLGQLGDSRDRLRTETRRAAEVQNGSRLLRALVDRAEVGSDSSARFYGSSVETSFVSWCEAPGGWLERCRVTLELSTEEDHTIVRANLGTSDPLTLSRRDGRLAFRYLDAATPALRWRERWDVEIAMPAAIGLFGPRDTLVLRIGARP